MTYAVGLTALIAGRSVTWSSDLGPFGSDPVVPARRRGTTRRVPAPSPRTRTVLLDWAAVMFGPGERLLVTNASTADFAQIGVSRTTAIG